MIQVFLYSFIHLYFIYCIVLFKIILLTFILSYFNHMQSMLGTNKHRPVSVNATQINNPTQTELKLYIYLSRLNKIKLSSIKLS